MADDSGAITDLGRTSEDQLQNASGCCGGRNQPAEADVEGV